MDEQLLADIVAFCGEHSLSDRQFGELALNDSHFVRHLRGTTKSGKPREPRRATIEQVRRFMAEYAPPAQAEAA